VSIDRRSRGRAERGVLKRSG